MAKNIVIFADGTGQRGGSSFDERRSNIYKLYRASRCGPDSTVDPKEQLAFYDPGIGSLPDDVGFFKAIYRKIYNILGQATGLGITANIIDCYEAIIQMWEPGDKIFLFGFSRGAYTVRCLATVLDLCGVPLNDAHGKRIDRSAKNARKIAKEGVIRIYQHASSPGDKKYAGQRDKMAQVFRKRFGSNQDDDCVHFIGVFDTVSALINQKMLVLLIAATILIFAGLSGLGSWLFGFSFLIQLAVLVGCTGAIACVGLFLNNLKFARSFEGIGKWESLHMSSPRIKVDDRHLSSRVGFARHGISIDEDRESFPRVPWGEPGVWFARDGIAQLEQLWFPGNHSDIGGSYSENESRLSDIALEWMVHEATRIPQPLIIDMSVLHLFPDPVGQQHDESKDSALFKRLKIKPRVVPSGAKLHSSVLDRMKAAGIIHYGELKPYRPVGLSNHPLCSEFYKELN